MRRASLFRIAALLLLVVVVASAMSRDYNGFDLSDSLIPADEIHLGGPPRDGIPAIDEPRFVAASEAAFPADDGRVLGLVLDGHARAYPIAIMNWHEVVNDRLAGEPVAVTYCPLCGTGVAFAARSAQGELSFGVSGLLYNSDVLLYDRQTESLWSQLLMQAIAGDARGQRLTPLPLQHTTWKAWKDQHPDTLVLSTDTGFVRDYRRDPYAGYANDRSLYFPVSGQSRRYHPKERVLGLEIDGRFKAYPFAELSQAGQREIADEFAGRPIRIRFDPDNASATALDGQGNDLPGVTAFWFAWYAFHPDTEVFTAAR